MNKITKLGYKSYAWAEAVYTMIASVVFSGLAAGLKLGVYASAYHIAFSPLDILAFLGLSLLLSAVLGILFGYIKGLIVAALYNKGILPRIEAQVA